MVAETQGSFAEHIAQKSILCTYCEPTQKKPFGAYMLLQSICQSPISFFSNSSRVQMLEPSKMCVQPSNPIYISPIAIPCTGRAANKDTGVQEYAQSKGPLSPSCNWQAIHPSGIRWKGQFTGGRTGMSILLCPGIFMGKAKLILKSGRNHTCICC